MARWAVHPEQEPSTQVQALAAQVERDLSPTHVKRLQELVRKLAENLEAFDVSRVRYEGIQRAGLMASPAPA